MKVLGFAAALAATPAAAQHEGHIMPAPAAPAQAAASQPPITTPAARPDPTVPTDHAADSVFGAEVMARARATLAKEHGGARYSQVMFDLAEIRPGRGGATYAWEAQAWFGGDFDRLVVKSEGEGETRGGVEAAEVQLLWSRAIAPYFDAQAGVRYDLRPRPDRAYLTLGVEGLAPYWFEVEALAFVSDKGEVSARLEVEHDMRITQRLILQPRIETNMAFQSTPARGIGAGITDVELGLRLRYEIAREFAPYVGIAHEASIGKTADLARAAGEDSTDTRLVLGVRAWF